MKFAKYIYVNAPVSLNFKTVVWSTEQQCAVGAFQPPGTFEHIQYFVVQTLMRFLCQRDISCCVPPFLFLWDLQILMNSYLEAFLCRLGVCPGLYK